MEESGSWPIEIKNQMTNQNKKNQMTNQNKKNQMTNLDKKSNDQSK